MKSKTSSYCPNCHFPLPYKARFCARCGQKTDAGIMSVGALARQVWYRVLHLESRSLRYMWLLFIPGYVSVEYFKGRQKRYPQPIRFFFIVAFLFLFTLNHLVNLTGMRAEQNNSGLVFKAGTNKNTPKYDFFETGKKRAEYEILRQTFDSLPEPCRTPEAQQAVDSLLNRHFGRSVKRFEAIMAISQNNSRDSITLNLGFNSIRLSSLDAFYLDADSIIAKYGVTNWLDKASVRQGIKTLADPAALMKVYLGSLGWTILTLVAFMSAILTLLYWRQKRYYVEHFIFMLNEHTSMFLLLLLAMWVNYVVPLNKTVWLLLTLWLAISPVLAMKRFYGQGWGATTFKSFLTLMAYAVGFILFFTLGMMVAFFML